MKKRRQGKDFEDALLILVVFVWMAIFASGHRHSEQSTINQTPEGPPCH